MSCVYLYLQRFQQYADVLTKDLHASRRWFGGWDIGRRLPIVFFSYIAMLPSVALVCYAQQPGDTTRLS